MAEVAFHVRLLRATQTALAATAIVLATMPAIAAPGAGPQPYYGVPNPAPPFLDPFAPRPESAPTRTCDGSEPIFGGVFGATAGGLLAAALGEHDGRIDPGATLFGVIAGAMVGATLATSHCPAE